MIHQEPQAAVADSQAFKDNGLIGQELNTIEKRRANQSNDSVSYEGDNDDSIIYSQDMSRQMTKTKLEDLKSRA